MKLFLLLVACAFAVQFNQPTFVKSSGSCRSCLGNEEKKICEYKNLTYCCDAEDDMNAVCLMECKEYDESNEKYFMCPSGESCGETDVFVHQEKRKVKVSANLDSEEVCLYRISSGNDFEFRNQSGEIEILVKEGRSEEIETNLFLHTFMNSTERINNLGSLYSDRNDLETLRLDQDEYLTLLVLPEVDTNFKFKTQLDKPAPPPIPDEEMDWIIFWHWVIRITIGVLGVLCCGCCTGCCCYLIKMR
jgi:hypothetical protein